MAAQLVASRVVLSSTELVGLAIPCQSPEHHGLLASDCVLLIIAFGFGTLSQDECNMWTLVLLFLIWPGPETPLKW
jgi:hypothetical protein